MQWNDADIIRSEQGLAYLEFALALPLLLLLLLGGVEVSRFVNLNQKLDKVANTVADVVSQSPTVSSDDLDRLLGAADAMTEPYNFSNAGRIVVTSVAKAAGQSARVRWQHCGGGALAEDSRVGDVGDIAVLPSGFTMRDGEDIVIAEVFYNFVPVLNSGALGTSLIYKEAVLLPRLGALDSFISSCP